MPVLCGPAPAMSVSSSGRETLVTSVHIILISRVIMYMITSTERRRVSHDFENCMHTGLVCHDPSACARWYQKADCVYSAFSFFSKTLFDFKKSISGPIELKFSGKTPNEVLYAPIYFWGVCF